ncbi:MAG: hypothetical protein NQU48_00200 [Hadesarchaea archaeon]|jgi:hypothetical protein|nr:hypothetical protein [Hadesarchaea archaeon]
MEVRPIAELMEEMRRRYRRYPSLRGEWRVLVGGDDHGYGDFFFHAPGLGLWQIKGEMMSPFELLGLGARFSVKRMDEEIRRVMEEGEPVPFGLASFHPSSRNRLVVASGVGCRTESTRRLSRLLPGHEGAERRMREGLEELKRRMGRGKEYL